MEAQYNPEFVLPAPEDASPELARIVRRMCSFRAADRYQTMEGVLEELAALAERTGAADEAAGVWAAPDLETETYHEPEPGQPDGEGTADGEDTPQSREEYHRRQKSLRMCYEEDNRCYWFLLTILFTLLLKSMQPAALTVSDGAFWILPGCLLAVCVLVNIPMLMLAGVCASGIWLWTEITGHLAFLDFLYRYDVGWIALTVVLYTLYRYHLMRIDWEQETFHDPDFADAVMDWLGILLLIAGIVLTVLRLGGLVAVPDAVRRIHPVWTGLALLVSVNIPAWADSVRDAIDADGDGAEGGSADEQRVDEG